MPDSALFRFARGMVLPQQDRMARSAHVFSLIAAFVAAVAGGCSSSSTPLSQDATGYTNAGPATAIIVPPRASAKDAYVLISGGGTPLTNNYSQYLQAKAVVDYFDRECRPDQTWVFFGAGNRADAPPLLADVRRESKRDGLLVQSWLPGALSRNRPANRTEIVRALKEEILPTVREGGTLYLFVGDHGELAGKGEREESAITLWQMKRGRRRSTGWFTDENEILGVAELREVLTAGLGQGRVVFCMTQCHSGGFHELGVAREMSPPREWFSSVPTWAAGASSGLRLAAAGFTATDQASPAAGCDADPDPELWAGYERFLPESLFGKDLMSGQPKGGALASFAAAHERATLVDQTIDKPRATSEHYLETWARVIETRLTNELRVTTRTREAVQAFHRAVDRGEIALKDAALAERARQFAAFARQLAEQAPEEKTLLLTGTRKQLEAAMQGTAAGGDRGRRRMIAALRRTWKDSLRPAWKAAVLSDTVAGLHGAALRLEKELLKLEDDGRDFLFPRGDDDTPLHNEIYWTAGYGEPAKVDPEKAAAIAQWGAQRRTRIVLWAQTSGDAKVREAAEKIGPAPLLADEAPRPLSRETAAERVLFYRRVLAAWQFLVTMQAKSALTELDGIIALERTPLRQALRGSASGK